MKTTHRQPLKKIPVILLPVMFILAIGLLFVSHDKQAYATLNGWNAGNIISDYVMGNKNTMNESQIQAFLKSKNSCNDSDYGKYVRYTNSGYQYSWRDGHFVCMADESFNSESAAHIIWQAAQDYSINPQVLIVLLQKEQGLVTDTWPNWNSQYRSATGYGCPDTAACDSQYFGFKNQIRKAAALFREVLNGGWTNNKGPGVVWIGYNPNAGCGGSNINVQNRATAALYRYTPYQPNQSALNAGYGTGDGCGAYGNRNFYNYFTDWFGSTQTQPKVSYIPNGDYYIVPSFNNSKSIGFTSNSTDNGSPLKIYTKSTNDTSLKITRNNDDGSYTIVSNTSGKAIDVSNAEMVAGATLQQWQPNGTAAQRWNFYNNGNGLYTISVASFYSLVIDVKNQLAADGNQIQLYESNNTAAQKFYLVPVSQPVPNGEYFAISKLNNSSVLDVVNGSTTAGTSVQLWTKNNSAAQKWKINYNSNTGYYTIVGTGSNRSLDVDNAGTTNGTKIKIWDSNSSCAQNWRISLSGDSSEIISACSDLLVDVLNGDKKDGTKMQLWERNGSSAQKWSLSPVPAQPTTPPSQPPSAPTGETYIIASKLDRNKVIDVAGGGTANGTNAWLYTRNNTNAQKWLVTNIDSYYTFTNIGSSKVLDLDSANTTSGSNVKIWQNNNSCAQKWIANQQSDGSFEFASACSNSAVLDAAGGSATNGTNIHIWQRNNTNAQRWFLIPM